MLLELLSALLLSSADAAPNGFDLSLCLIDRDQILPGGPPRDGIPALDQPAFHLPSMKDKSDPDSRVLALELGGQAKAYPINILNWHELANDTLAGVPILVSYCPLCGTGLVFSRNLGGRTLTFGVSGLLFQSDVLMYDRQTESLWSQLLGKAISGPMAGTKLEVLPSMQTSLSLWLKEFPKSEILSQPKSFQRPYQKNPYEGYEERPGTFFPVSEPQPRGLHPKARVLGLDLNGQAWALPLDKIRQSNGPIELGDGDPITIHWDGQGAWALDSSGTRIPATEAFAFAWFSFHPQSKLWPDDL